MTIQERIDNLINYAIELECTHIATGNNYMNLEDAKYYYIGYFKISNKIKELETLHTFKIHHILVIMAPITITLNFPKQF